MATAAAIVSASFARGIRPEPEITVSQWADMHRIVPKPSPEPGQWRTDRVPYAREIMDNLSPSSPVNITVLMKAAQGAGTEILLNAFGCWMHRYPDSAMLVQPTTKTAKRFVRTRLDRMIDACPSLREIVAKPRAHDSSNTTTQKDFGGDSLIITGANSGAELRSNPIRYLGLDEVDGYPTDLDGEGEATELALQRTAAFRNRKVFMLSTPTLEDTSAIYKWFQRGDQRHFYVPCPLCGHEQPLIWFPKEGAGVPGGLRWPKGEPEKARYQCVACGDMFEEWRKIEMLARGEWVAAAPSVGQGPDTIVRSYSINALYYPYGWPESKWTNLAAKWDADHSDPVKRKSFINLKLGQPYKDPAEAKADTDTLMARREAYGPEVPVAVGVITVGADVQANRIEAESVGWCKDEESYSLEYRVFLGDTEKPEVWAEFDEWLKTEYLSESGVTLSIRATCVDSRFRKEVVRKWCANRWSRKVWAIVGQDGQNRPVWSTKAKRQRGAIPPPFTVGVDAAKESIYSRLKLERPGPGFAHFPAGRDRDYFEMLTAEVRVPDYTGPQPDFVWKKKSPGARNEALDARCYAYAALCGLVMTTAMRLNSEVDSIRRQAETKSRAIEAAAIQPVFAAPPPPVVQKVAQRIHPAAAYSNDPYL